MKGRRERSLPASPEVVRHALGLQAAEIFGHLPAAELEALSAAPAEEIHGRVEAHTDRLVELAFPGVRYELQGRASMSWVARFVPAGDNLVRVSIYRDGDMIGDGVWDDHGTNRP
jgi:hypothetical protein